MAAALSTTNQRSTILAASIRLLRSDGPNGLTIRKVATSAGCSTQGVYTWFGGKNELVDAIFIDGFVSFRDALASASGAPGLESLIALGVEYRQWAHAHTTEYQVMFTRAVPEHTPSQRAQAAALDAFSVLVEAAESNRSPARLGDVDTELFACHFWATAHGHVMLDICGLGAEVHGVDQAGRSPEHQYVDSIRAAIRGFQVQPPSPVRDNPRS